MTPSVMDVSRQKLQKLMADIKKYMIDIAHASHHLDHLTKAAATNKLPRGLTVEPRMMLVDADDETEAEWRNQTRLNTLAYINIALNHYKKVITRKTGQIAEKQKAVLECITDASLTDKQKKALKLSYEGLLSNAEMEAQKIKKDRDEASQSKLDEHQAKRQRTESYRYDIDHTCTNPPKDIEHFTEVLTREETHTDPEVIPTDHNRRGGPKRKNRRHRLRYKRSVFHCNSVVRSSNDNLYDNVVNLSSYPLSNAQLNILSKGLSFVPYAQFPTQCKMDEISDFIRKLRLRYIYRATQTKPNPFRLKSKQNPKNTNYPELERLIDRIQLTLSQIHPAIGKPNLPKDGMSLIRKLSKEQDVIINTADKGSCIVLLDRDKYVQAGRNHLDDTQTYTRLSGDITDTIKKTITIKLNKLHEKGLLSKSHYTFCLPPEDYRTSLMYFLIKLHKNPHSYRPICSCVNSVTSNISRFLDHWLKQAVKLLPSYISDSTHFIKTIEAKTFEKDILLCSIDITNMYTNIPIDEGNGASIRALQNLKCSKLATETPDTPILLELLEMVTKNNVFEFDGEYYLQTKGVPMGNIMAPSYSGLFMGELEQKLIQLAADKIKLWVRYIDDIFLIWLGDRTSFENFVQSCNKLHPTIKFTSECSATEINFLDMTIYKGTDFQTKQILDIKTYTKPTNKQTYVHGSSFHPPGIGKSIALGESQ